MLVDPREQGSTGTRLTGPYCNQARSRRHWHGPRPLAPQPEWPARGQARAGGDPESPADSESGAARRSCCAASGTVTPKNLQARPTRSRQRRLLAWASVIRWPQAFEAGLPWCLHGALRIGPRAGPGGSRRCAPSQCRPFCPSGSESLRLRAHLRFEADGWHWLLKMSRTEVKFRIRINWFSAELARQSAIWTPNPRRRGMNAMIATCTYKRPDAPEVTKLKAKRPDRRHNIRAAGGRPKVTRLLAMCRPGTPLAPPCPGDSSSGRVTKLICRRSKFFCPD